jgi:DNA-binding transcriptional ArsR family regulator
MRRVLRQRQPMPRVARPLVSKHLQVLREIGLVTTRREGRQTICRMNADALRTVHGWCGMFAKRWRGQLRRIKAHAEENQ